MSSIGPFWSTVIVAVGLVFGLSFFGYRVMLTIGTKIAKLSPSRAFVAQICTSTITLASSLLGLPLSTTHIIVGSVLGISYVDEGLQGMKWQVISGIFISWIVTVPLAGFISVLSFALLRFLL